MHRWIVLPVLAVLVGACASSQPVKSEKYATYKNQDTFEEPVPRVWKGVEELLRKYKIVERDPEEEPTPVDLSHLTEAVWETDWIYGRSRTKYVEYKVNGFPRKQYLQNRVKYVVRADTVIGGTKVTVQTSEEVEELDDDGTPKGYSGVEPDSAIARDFLDRLRVTLTALPDLDLN